MRPKAVLVALGAVLAIAWSAAPAAAAPCGLPDSKPLWIDYAEGSVPFRNELFGKPGVIAATSGTATPQALRERGARTVYWQMNIRNFVGTPLRRQTRSPSRARRTRSSIALPPRRPARRP